jgi:hypothetical protein
MDARWHVQFTSGTCRQRPGSDGRATWQGGSACTTWRGNQIRRVSTGVGPAALVRWWLGTWAPLRCRVKRRSGLHVVDSLVLRPCRAAAPGRSRASQQERWKE